MYIDANTIILAASALTACGVLITFIIKISRKLDNNDKQNDVIRAIQDEQKILCYGLRGALQGLIEQGCDGPCKDALAVLDKHLNQAAHNPDLRDK